MPLDLIVLQNRVSIYGPSGSSVPKVKSIEYLTWQCRGTPMAEEKIFLYSSMTLSIFCCCVEEPYLEAMGTTLFFPWGRIIRKTNFLVWEMILLHCFAVIKDMVVGGATFSITYNLLAKVIVTKRGLDSYRVCHFHKYGCPNNTWEISRGETSHTTSSMKGLML